MKKIGLIFAMEEEIQEFIKLIKVDNEYQLFGLPFYETVINDNHCLLTVCGVGKVNAARTTQILIDNYGVDMIINVGVAGGVSDNLKVGDIIIGERLVQHDFDITAFNHDKGYIPNVGVFINSDEYLIRIASLVIKENVYKGIIASGDIFLTDSLMSNKIRNKFDALCVEMEGASIAQVAYLSNTPFLVLRSISDIPNNQNVITYEEFLEESSRKIADALYKIIMKIDI